jgi:hypothetical protein
VVDALGIREFDFPLARMHIHIHIRRIDFQEQDGYRISIFGDEVTIRFYDSMGKQAIMDGPPVDKEVNTPGIGPSQSRLPGVPMYFQPLVPILKKIQLIGRFPAQGFGQS